MARLANNLNDICLYVLVFSITFEYWDPFKLIGTYSVTYFASVLYLLSWIPLIRVKLRKDILIKFGMPLFLFVLSGLIATALRSEYSIELKDSYNYRVLLLIILMIFMASHLAKDGQMLSRIMNIYVLSVVVMYLLFALGIGVSYENNRLLMFGDNPNSIGEKVVIALLYMIARIINGKFSLQKLVIGLFVCIPLFGMIFSTASRAAFISVFVGMSIIVMFSKLALAKKAFVFLSGLILSFFIFSYSMENYPVLKQRLMHTLETGDIGRNQLWSGALELISDNFIIGVGFPGLLPEMFKYIGRAIGPHNIFLYVLITTGIIGFVFYMLFLLRLIGAVINNYLKGGSVIFLLVLIIVILNMSKAGGAMGTIFYWFVFSILIGSTFLEKWNSNSIQYAGNNQT